jgi:hypothetical protein
VATGKGAFWRARHRRKPHEIIPAGPDRHGPQRGHIRRKNPIVGGQCRTIKAIRACGNPVKMGAGQQLGERQSLLGLRGDRQYQN